MRVRFVFVSLALMGVATMHSAMAETFTVTNTLSSGPGSLHQAITDLNAANGNIHVIEAQAGLSGTISVSAPLPAITKPVVRLTGSGRDELTLDLARAQNLVVDVPPNGLFILEDLTIANGLAVAGGCLDTFTGSPLLEIRRVRFTECEAQDAVSAFGGAIVASGDVRISDSEFRNNVANGLPNGSVDGGAIFHERGSLVIERSSFIGNTAIGADDDAGIQSWGGAVYSQRSTLSISDAYFEGNTAESAGALFHGLVAGDGRLERSVFEDNSARFAGTAVYLQGPEQMVDPLFRVENSLFFNNHQLPGSGAGVIGGGATPLSLRNNTFFNNLADSGGGAFLYWFNAGPIPVLSHNVINTPNGSPTCRFVSGTPVPALASENVYAGGRCFANDPTDQVETDLQFDQSIVIPIADAKMVSVPVPLVTSPVINSGAPTASNADPAACLEEDIFAVARSTSPCDAGVFEGGLELELFSDGFEPVPIR